VAEREGFNKIAVGHHADDSAEIILINLLRGSGPSGLKGIPPVRGRIIRPLIHASRDSILLYLTYNQLTYRIDSSNYDDRFLRNKIRHQLLPLLKTQYNLKISEALNRLGEILRTEEEWFHQSVATALEMCVQTRDSDKIHLSIDKLQTYHTAIQRRMIRCAISHAKGDLRRISYDHVDAVLDLLKNTASELWLDLPDMIRISKQENRLSISREKKNLRLSGRSGNTTHSASFEHTISAADILEEPIFIKEADLYLKFSKLKLEDVGELNIASQDMAFFDWDCLKLPLTVRNYRAGDIFIPLGMTSLQRIKKFFINNKISRHERSRIPIVLSGDGIMWIVGLRISDSYKVTPSTTTVLCAEVLFNLRDFQPEKKINY
jgi:tRNA(Ile)-lysidine synthase